MLTQSVVDPVKVVRYALHDSVSIAGLLITTEVGIVESKDDSDSGAPAAGGMPGGMPGMGGMGF